MTIHEVAARSRDGVAEATRVLVVEDDLDHAQTVREVLQDEGYVVEGAFDGRAALERLQLGPPPDLVLVDLYLPHMDGWDLVASMRARQALATVPVIVMTGAGERTLTSAPVSAGYLAKPLDRARLLETIAVCLTRAGRRPSGSYSCGE